MNETPLQIPDDIMRTAGNLVDASLPEEPYMIACMVLVNFAPIIVAVELRRLADELHELRRTLRDEDGRGIRSSGLAAAISRMRERAAELDTRGGAS